MLDEDGQQETERVKRVLVSNICVGFVDEDTNITRYFGEAIGVEQVYEREERRLTKRNTADRSDRQCERIYSDATRH